MGKKELKALTSVFIASVLGIVFSFGMSIYTAVQKHRAEQQVTPISIPLPATGS